MTKHAPAIPAYRTLTDLEGVIERGLSTFVDVGAAPSRLERLHALFGADERFDPQAAD